MHEFTFTAELWEHDADPPWCFLDLPHADADDIADLADGGTAFGSVRVEVTVGATTWRTSLFPDTTRATYLLPVKRAVRTAERIEVGDLVDVRLRLLDV